MADLPKAVTLEVATPLGMALAVETDSVQLPSVAGEFGALPGHVPLLAAVKPGILSYREGGQLKRAAVGAGYVETTADRVRLITEFFVLPEQLKRADVERDVSAASERLRETKAPIDDLQYREAERALQWAEARLSLLQSSAN